MNLNDHPQLVAAWILEVVLVVGVAGVFASMRRMRVNGPCQLCLALLLAWRAVVVAGGFGDCPGVAHFAGLAFAGGFLHALHHLAVLVHDLRRWRGQRGATARG